MMGDAEYERGSYGGGGVGGPAMAAQAQVAGDAGVDLNVKRSKLMKKNAKSLRTGHGEEDSARSNSSDRGSVISRRKRSSHRKIEKLLAENAHYPSLESVNAGLGKDSLRDSLKQPCADSGERHYSPFKDANAGASTLARTPSVEVTSSREQFLHISQSLAAALPRALRAKKKTSSTSTASQANEPGVATGGASIPLAPVQSQLSTGDTVRFPLCPMNSVSSATSPWPYSYSPDYLQAYTHAAPAWTGYMHGSSPAPWPAVYPSPGWNLQNPMYPSAGFPGLSQNPPIQPVPGLGASEWYLQQFRMLTLQNQAAASVLYSMLPVIADLSKGDASKKSQANSTPNLLRLAQQTQSQILPPSTSSASTQWAHSHESKGTQSSLEHLPLLVTQGSGTQPLETTATQSSLEYLPRNKIERKDAATYGSISETALAAPGRISSAYRLQTTAQQTEPPPKRNAWREARAATKTVDCSSTMGEDCRVERGMAKSPKLEYMPGSPVAKRQHLEFPLPADPSFPMRRPMVKAGKKSYQHPEKMMFRGFAHKAQGSNPKLEDYCIKPAVFHGPGYPPAAPFMPQHLTTMSVPLPTVMNRPTAVPPPQMQHQQHFQHQLPERAGTLIACSSSPAPPVPPRQLPPRQQHLPWRRPILALQRAFRDSVAANNQEHRPPAPLPPAQRPSQTRHPQMQAPSPQNQQMLVVPSPQHLQMQAPSPQAVHPQLRAPSPQTVHPQMMAPSPQAVHPQMRAPSPQMQAASPQIQVQSVQMPHHAQQQSRMQHPTQLQPDASWSPRAVANKQQHQPPPRDKDSSRSSSSAPGTPSPRCSPTRREVAQGAEKRSHKTNT